MSALIIPEISQPCKCWKWKKVGFLNFVDPDAAAHDEPPGPEVIKLFSCPTQLSMKFFPLINVKMPTIVGILTFLSRKNSILGLSEP